MHLLTVQTVCGLHGHMVCPPVLTVAVHLHHPTAGAGVLPDEGVAHCQEAVVMFIWKVCRVHTTRSDGSEGVRFMQAHQQCAAM